MKSYGKVDASWDDARFQAMIEEIREMVMESKTSCAIGQDRNGNVVVTSDGPNLAYVYVCWTHPPKNKESQEDEKVFVDHHRGKKYSAEQMVPRVRNALIMGIIDFGGLGFLSEGRIQLLSVVRHARMIVKMHGEPFILGQIDKKIRTAPLSERDRHAGITPNMSKSIVVAPLSERGHFVDYASCVVTKHRYWSLLDRIPDSGVYREYDRRQRDLKTVRISDRRSILVDGPTFIYDAILENGRNARRGHPTKWTVYRIDGS